MNLGRAFGFISEDEQWITKLLIGGVVMLIPILGQLTLLGYMVQTAQNVAQNKPRPLPDWGDFGQFIVKGLYLFVISLVYAIPLIIFIVVLSVVTGVIAGASGEQDPAAGMLAVILCLQLLMFVVGLVLQMFIFAAWTRYILTDSLGAALQFGEVYQMFQRSLKTWIILLLIYLLCSLVGSLGAIACGIGVLFSAFYAQGMVFGHVLGQVAAQERGSGSAL